MPGVAMGELRFVRLNFKVGEIAFWRRSFREQAGKYLTILATQLVVVDAHRHHGRSERNTADVIY
jgi:hypothetical protein